MGIGAPNGNYYSGTIEFAPNLSWGHNGIVPLAKMFSDRLGVPVALTNDANAAAIGEMIYGVARGMKNFIVVALSSGTGSCFFSDGHAHMGFEGFSGELGHVCIENEGRLCGCGSRGCLEAYTGTKGIIYTAQELMANSDEPSLMRDVEHLSPRIIKECCDKGDALAIETFRRTGEYLGLGLANYASLVNPQAIILTGGISHAGKWLLEPTRVSFEKHVFYTMRDRVKILVSKLDGHERDVLGASVLAWEVPEYSLFK
jgi:glucokinase